MRGRIFCPLPYRNINFFEDVKLEITNNIYIEKMYDSDYGALRRASADKFYTEISDVTSCCFYSDIENIRSPSINLEEELNTFVRKIKFCFNHINKMTPPLISFASVVDTQERSQIYTFKEIDSHSDLKKGTELDYTIMSDIETIKGIFNLVEKSIQKDKNVSFLIDRYNLAASRKSIIDKIVDAAICLESLISSSQEISFQFSLFNSFIYSSDPTVRNECFDLLKELYTSRSNIVHGSTDTSATRKIQKIESNWDKIVDIIRSCITYHLVYISSKEKSSWDAHLKSLVFGTEKRIIDMEEKNGV